MNLEMQLTQKGFTSFFSNKNSEKEKEVSLWRERLENFYKDEKYLSDINQFTIYGLISTGKNQSEITNDGLEVDKTILNTHYINLRNPFSQLYESYD